ncbi:MAG TPA: vitamin K epoxide reductase family protein [Pyrinomonadaceae bacterium]|jgi:uncharacterized membrane protein|nr:vitamin K epoxide reductase family protein [Pyrinomonadaceae bacterium]
MNAVRHNGGDAPLESLEPQRDAARRRATWLDWLAAAVALAGLADALYLTAQHFAGQSVRCTVVTGCNEVLGSAYATVGPFPVALLGALAYFTAFSLAILSAFGYPRTRQMLALLVALMLASTLWFLYVQAFVLRQFCSYCLLSAIVTLSLTCIVVAGRFWRNDRTQL